jgi:hypothetical protein
MNMQHKLAEQNKKEESRGFFFIHIICTALVIGVLFVLHVVNNKIPVTANTGSTISSSTLNADQCNKHHLLFNDGSLPSLMRQFMQ